MMQSSSQQNPTLIEEVGTKSDEDYVVDDFENDSPVKTNPKTIVDSEQPNTKQDIVVQDNEKSQNPAAKEDSKEQQMAAKKDETQIELAQDFTQSVTLNVVPPSSGQAPEPFCLERQSSDSSINSAKNKPVESGQGVGGPIVKPKQQNNFRMQWQQLQQNKGNKAPRGQSNQPAQQQQQQQQQLENRTQPKQQIQAKLRGSSRNSATRQSDSQQQQQFEQKILASSGTKNDSGYKTQTNFLAKNARMVSMKTGQRSVATAEGGTRPNRTERAPLWAPKARHDQNHHPQTKASTTSINHSTQSGNPVWNQMSTDRPKLPQEQKQSFALATSKDFPSGMKQHQNPSGFNSQRGYQNNSQMSSKNQNSGPASYQSKTNHRGSVSNAQKNNYLVARNVSQKQNAWASQQPLKNTRRSTADPIRDKVSFTVNSSMENTMEIVNNPKNKNTQPIAGTSGKMAMNSNKTSISAQGPPNPDQYPEIKFKVDTSFPIKILDSMIDIEQKQHNGFTLYNRGNDLKGSLISSDNVRGYLSGKMDPGKGRPELPGAIVIDTMLQDQALDDDKQWRLMMDYFKTNPGALLDALPSPTGSDDEDALAGFNTGLTPKKTFANKFGPNATQTNRPGAKYFNQHKRSRLDSARSDASRQSSRLGSARSSARSGQNTPKRETIRAYAGGSRPGSAVSSQSSGRKMQTSGFRSGSRDLRNRGPSQGAQERAQQRNNSYRPMNSHMSADSRRSSSSAKKPAFGAGPGRQPNYQSKQQSGQFRTYEQQRQNSNKDFRIRQQNAVNSKGEPMQKTKSSVQARLHEKKTMMEKENASRKQRTDTAKNMMNKDMISSNSQGLNSVPSSITAKEEKKTNGGNSSSYQTLAKEQSQKKVDFNQDPSQLSAHPKKPINPNNKKVAIQNVKFQDFFDSPYYQKQVLLGKDALGFANDIADRVLKEEEMELLDSQLRQYRMKRGQHMEDLVKQLPVLTQKAHFTLSYLVNEIVGQREAHFEMDFFARTRHFEVDKVPERFPQETGRKVFFLDNLVQKIHVLKDIRVDIIKFLEVVHARELAFSQIKDSVKSMQTEAFFYPELENQLNSYQNDDNEGAGKDEEGMGAGKKQDPNEGHDESVRAKIKKYGNQLIEQTERVLEKSKPFLVKLNKCFEAVNFDCFVFQEADYCEIIMKEVLEISAILHSYEVTLNAFTDRRHLINETGHFIDARPSKSSKQQAAH